MYVWADGIYVKVGLESSKAALLVLIGGLADGTKVVLAVESGQRESTESWATVLRDLTARGLRAPRCTMGDGALGLWSAVAKVWPTSAEQRCWNHKLRNVVDAVPLTQQPAVQVAVQAIAAAESVADAETARRAFHRAYRLRFPKASERTTRSRLGAHDYVLSVSEGALATPAHHERRRIPLCRRAPAHVGGEALQEGGARHGNHLALASCRRTPLPKTQCAQSLQGPISRSNVSGRHCHHSRHRLTRESRRLTAHLHTY